MTATVWAALALAVATLILPASPRRRFLLPRRQFHFNRRFRAMRVAVLGSVLLFASIGWGPLVAAAAAVLAATVAERRRRRKRRLAAHRERNELAAALEVLVSELRVGSHPVRAFEVAAAESGGAVGAALRAVSARAVLGADVPGGLRSVAGSSINRADWTRLAGFWELATEHGLAISDLMRAAHLDMVERQRFSARVDAGMAGARATAVILAGLPVLGVAMGQLIGAAPLNFLTGPGAGGWFLLTGVALVCGGLRWADRITERAE